MIRPLQPAAERAQAALDLQSALMNEFRAKIATEENAVKYIEADIMLNNGRIWWPKNADDARQAKQYIAKREADKTSTNQMISSDRSDLAKIKSSAAITRQDLEKIRHGNIPNKYRPESEKAAEAKAAADAKAKADAAAKAKAAADAKAKADAAAKAKAAADAKAKADAAAKAKAAADAKAKADAAAKAKAKADREALFAKAGVKPAPVYTPQMVAEANAALKAPGAMVLNQTPGSAQMALAGAGVWTAAGDVAGRITNWFNNALSKLSVPAVSPGLLKASMATLWFHSEPAGQGSDKVPGRDVPALFAFPARALADAKAIEAGMKTVNMPARGSLVKSNGLLALQLLKTGNGGIPAAVQVLTAVRDEKTGLDRITVPAVAGAPSRTVLINPAAAPSAPLNTGHQAPPVPVTPVHTGTDVKPVENIVVTTSPVADTDGLQDFIYWQPDAQGTGVEPIYVVFSDPLDSGRFTRKQLDKKYKHAIDFGISDTKKNSETLTKFRDAVEAHLSDKGTFKKGTYIREKDSTVFFNPKTNNVVVIKKDGSFSTGMKLKPGTPQYKNYMEKGVLL